jgi:hypothetical protein
MGFDMLEFVIVDIEFAQVVVDSDEVFLAVLQKLVDEVVSKLGEFVLVSKIKILCDLSLMKILFNNFSLSAMMM